MKFQLARFEVLGAPGWGALGELAGYARERGLLVIADGKRGDIDVTAAAYAAALFGGLRDAVRQRSPACGADLATVNPLMGDRRGRAVPRGGPRAWRGGVLLLVRTSNPGARDVEDLALAGGERVWERLARDGRAARAPAASARSGSATSARSSAPPSPTTSPARAS